MFHQKTDRISTPATAKTLVYFLSRRYGKRRGFFVVKRTQSQVVCPSFFQFHKAPYDFYDVYTALNLLYGMLAYHLILKGKRLCSC